MVLTVLVNKRFVFIHVIRGQKINAVVLAFLRHYFIVSTPLFLSWYAVAQKMPAGQ